VFTLYMIFSKCV